MKEVIITTPSGDRYIQISPVNNVYMGERKIGHIWKGTRLYSPPLYRGSRIAKYHKEVPCWYGTPIEGSPTYQGDTRNRVLLDLIRHADRTE